MSELHLALFVFGTKTELFLEWFGIKNSKKKMQNSQISLFQESQLFMCASLKRCKSLGYFIEYYAYSPSTNKLKRVRIKLTKLAKRYTCVKQFKQFANMLVYQINQKLLTGWNPFINTNNEKSLSLTKVVDIIPKFLSEKETVCRKDTMRSYKSFCNQLTYWIESYYRGVMIKDFSSVVAIDFMEYQQNKGIRNVSYNNILKHARLFFQYCVDKKYIKENVFTEIKPKRKEQKERTIINEKDRQKITEYLKDTSQKEFLLILNLIYSSLIRPKEICNLKIKDINLTDKVIHVSGVVAKTHYERYAAITPNIENMIKELDLISYNDDFYIFGEQTLKPNRIAFNSHTLTKKWDKLRQELKLPKNYQLYSLRDTGINNLLITGIDTLSVMQHADHHDLSITTRYANHYNKDLVKKIYENSPNF